MSIAIRRATVSDIALLARHRVAMFRDMGALAPPLETPLHDATANYLRAAIPGGEYLGWVAETPAPSALPIGGAGVQLRTILPRPGFRADALELGPEAIVLNMYVEAEWRRRGVAAALLQTVLRELAARQVRRVVLHASEAGRPLYERSGFVATNEMLLTAPIST